MPVETCSTDDVAFGRRIDYWQDVVTGSFARCAVRISPRDASFHARLTTADLGAVAFTVAEYQAESDYQVVSEGVQGDASQNDWKGEYMVVASIPTGGDSFTLPPVNTSTPVDWEAMCAQQYPESSAEWVGVPGPAASPGPFGAPWMCLGAPGSVYDQTETDNGPVGLVG